jgi:DNA (cytosine-5)-methyltransferase 1
MSKYLAADLFCGAGGTSTGMVRAAEKRGISLGLVAVNHWKTAVETHKRNHPWARHLCADLASVEANPAKLVPGGRLNLLVASPECTHHSVARGGKPCSDQSRASAWHVMHWLELLNVQDLLLENVKEFADWGPILKRGTMIKGKWHKAGRPDPRQKKATFLAFVNGVHSLGYRVEWRVLNAADYGSATTRRRLFMRASKRKSAIAWPEASHAAQSDATHARWKSAREVIDWSLKGDSIFTRRTPLRPKTLARIEAGLRKFGGEAFIPFVIPMEHSGRAALRSVDETLPTITTAKGGAFGLCEPFIVQYQGGEDAKALRVHSVDNPLPTQPTENRFGLCEPFLTKYYGTGGARPVTEPMDTVTAKDRFALVEPRGVDILFRMLQPHELAAAMGFDGYEFTGTKTEQVRQIGNAVAVDPAEALCGSIMDAAGKGGAK